MRSCSQNRDIISNGCVKSAGCGRKSGAALCAIYSTKGSLGEKFKFSSYGSVARRRHVCSNGIEMERIVRENEKVLGEYFLN